MTDMSSNAFSGNENAAIWNKYLRVPEASAAAEAPAQDIATPTAPKLVAEVTLAMMKKGDHASALLGEIRNLHLEYVVASLPLMNAGIALKAAAETLATGHTEAFVAAYRAVVLNSVDIRPPSLVIGTLLHKARLLADLHGVAPAALVPPVVPVGWVETALLD